MKKLLGEVKNEARKLLIKKIQKIDKNILNKRNKKRYVLKSINSKNIIFPEFGKIKIYRRRYWDLETNGWVFLLDQKLGIEKWKRMSFDTINEIALKYLEYGSFEKVARLWLKSSVTKMTLCNNLKFARFKMKISNNHLKVLYKTIYINVDSIFLSKWKTKNKHEIKTFCFSTGRDEVGKNRYKLRNRFIHAEVNNKNMEKVKKSILKILKENYNFENIAIIGDGATWIKNMAKKINATYYADKFHFRKTIKDILSNKRYLWGINLIDTLEDKNLIGNTLLKAVTNKNGEVSYNNINKIGYIKNNLIHYKKTVNENIKSSIEAIQSHYIAKIFKNQRKGFKEKNLTTILNMNLNQCN